MLTAVFLRWELGTKNFINAVYFRRGMSEVYDYLIIGAGFGGLALGSLLAKKGKSVLLLEANENVGGHAYTMKVGKYRFCHDVQYLMGCQEGGPMRVFLQKIGLDKKISFNKMEEKSYDLINVKKKRIKIPFGLNNYCKYLSQLYPNYKESLEKFFKIEKKVFAEAKGYERILQTKDILLAPWKYPTIILYMNKTLEDVFNKFKFPKELRAILAGRMGNLSGRPSEISFLMYAGMDVAYSESAYFPKKGMHHLVDSVTKVIKENRGKILTNQEVTHIKVEKRKITSVKTSNKEYFAKEVISNIDPQRTMKLTGRKIPKKYKYQYSDSIFCIYLGLKGIDLRKHGFGKHNIWHHSDFDLDSEYWNEIKNDDFSHPWLFISIPSLLAEEGALCPKGNSTFEILTFTNYAHFKRVYEKDPKEYTHLVQKTYKEIIKIVDKNYLKEIEKYIETCTIHTPLDMERILKIPKGNVYGSRVTPKNYSFNRITFNSPFKNLHFVGANASFPGIMSVTVGAMDLFNRLQAR